MQSVGFRFAAAAGLAAAMVLAASAGRAQEYPAKPIIDRVNAAFVAALSDEEIKKQFFNRAVIARSSSPAEFQQFIASELARWRKVADAINVKK